MLVEHGQGKPMQSGSTPDEKGILKWRSIKVPFKSRHVEMFGNIVCPFVHTECMVVLDD